MKERIHNLTCCVCGGEAPAIKQWWNRDTGYGICPKCANEQEVRLDPESMKSYYGINGRHYFTGKEGQ